MALKNRGGDEVTRAIEEAEKTNPLMKASREESQRRTRAGSNRRRITSSPAKSRMPADAHAKTAHWWFR
jgi:hypothetical protein